VKRVQQTAGLYTLLLLQLTAFVCFAFPPQVQAQPVTVLNAQSPLLNVAAAGVFWLDQTGDATPEQVITGKRASLFTPSVEGAYYAMGRQASLWLHYRFKRESAADALPENWLLQFPQPLLDKVTVYQLNAAGTWATQTAGDTVAMPVGAEPGRYPQFQLQLGNERVGHDVRDVYVRVQSGIATTVDAKVSAYSAHSRLVQIEYLILGLTFGAMLLMMVTCLNQSWVYRDPAFSWYAGYVFLLTLATGAWTGVGAQFTWQSWGIWPDIAPGVLGSMAGGAALLVAHYLCKPGSQHRVFERLVRYWGLAGFGVGALVPFLDRRVAVMMVGAYLGLVIVGTLSRAALTWRARDPVGMWVFLAFTPMAVAATLLVGDRLGMLPTSWFSQYGVMVGFSIEMPLLLVALNLRSRERHSVEARAQALISQDALTGLLSAPIFQDRFKQIVARSRKIREPAAVMYIDLVNYRYIKKTWGVAVAEQSLLRSVIKLRRILRDVDTVGRIDEARFGVILEGVASRGPVTELAARLIAAGLMPLTGLKPEVILQFHVAVALLSEYPGSDADIGEALTTLMQRMGPRSRRPIRFLALEPTQVSPLEPTPDDSSR